MENTSLQALLREDEDRLLHTLRANESIEKSRDKSVETLSEELSSLLLRYNAACAPDRMRQALADCLAATARDTLGLLKAGGADKEVSRRESSGWAALLLMFAVAAAAARTGAARGAVDLEGYRRDLERRNEERAQRA